MKEKTALAMKVGAEIRRRRRDDCKRSQEEFAVDVGVARSYMGVIERGETDMSVELAKRVVSGLGVTLGEFFTSIGE